MKGSFDSMLGTRMIAGCLACAMALATFAGTSVSVASAAVPSNARLLQVGPKGLYSYDVSKGKNTLLIKGLQTTPYYPAAILFSPGKGAVAVTGSHRSDLAGTDVVKLAAYPGGRAFTVVTGTMCGVEGWTDKHHAVVWDVDGLRVLVDARTGRRSTFTGTPKYPADAPSAKTSGQLRYRVKVSNNVATVTLRKTGKRLARFKVPGSSSGVLGWSAGDGNVSPDGRYIAFENWRSPNNDAQFVSQVWVCTIKGAHAKKMAYLSGGFAWR
jgi:hypothetical protein